MRTRNLSKVSIGVEVEGIVGESLHRDLCSYPCGAQPLPDLSVIGTCSAPKLDTRINQPASTSSLSLTLDPEYCPLLLIRVVPGADPPIVFDYSLSFMLPRSTITPSDSRVLL
jgi:hypothetical protein